MRLRGRMWREVEIRTLRPDAVLGKVSGVLAGAVVSRVAIGAIFAVASGFAVSSSAAGLLGLID